MGNFFSRLFGGHGSRHSSEPHDEKERSLLPPTLKANNDLPPGKNSKAKDSHPKSSPKKSLTGEKSGETKKFTTTFETVVTPAAEESPKPQNNGRIVAPLATIEVDTDIQDREDDIEHAVVKIQAGVRGYLARKNLRQFSTIDSTSEPEFLPEHQEIPRPSESATMIPPPDSFSDSHASQKATDSSKTQHKEDRNQRESRSSSDIEILAPGTQEQDERTGDRVRSVTRPASEASADTTASPAARDNTVSSSDQKTDMRGSFKSANPKLKFKAESLRFDGEDVVPATAAKPELLKQGSIKLRSPTSKVCAEALRFGPSLDEERKQQEVHPVIQKQESVKFSSPKLKMRAESLKFEPSSPTDDSPTHSPSPTSHESLRKQDSIVKIANPLLKLKAESLRHESIDEETVDPKPAAVVVAARVAEQLTNPSDVTNTVNKIPEVIARANPRLKFKAESLKFESEDPVIEMAKPVVKKQDSIIKIANPMLKLKAESLRHDSLDEVDKPAVKAEPEQLTNPSDVTHIITKVPEVIARANPRLKFKAESLKFEDDVFEKQSPKPEAVKKQESVVKIANPMLKLKAESLRHESFDEEVKPSSPAAKVAPEQLTNPSDVTHIITKVPEVIARANPRLKFKAESLKFENEEPVVSETSKPESVKKQESIVKIANPLLKLKAESLRHESFDEEAKPSSPATKVAPEQLTNPSDVTDTMAHIPTVAGKANPRLKLKAESLKFEETTIGVLKKQDSIKLQSPKLKVSPEELAFAAPVLEKERLTNPQDVTHQLGAKSEPEKSSRLQKQDAILIETPSPNPESYDDLRLRSRPVEMEVLTNPSDVTDAMTSSLASETKKANKKSMTKQQALLHESKEHDAAEKRRGSGEDRERVPSPKRSMSQSFSGQSSLEGEDGVEDKTTVAKKKGKNKKKKRDVKKQETVIRVKGRSEDSEEVMRESLDPDQMESLSLPQNQDRASSPMISDEECAATKIQAAFRGHLCRKILGSREASPSPHQASIDELEEETTHKQSLPQPPPPTPAASFDVNRSLERRQSEKRMDDLLGLLTDEPAPDEMGMDFEDEEETKADIFAKNKTPELVHHVKEVVKSVSGVMTQVEEQRRRSVTTPPTILDEVMPRTSFAIMSDDGLTTDDTDIPTPPSRPLPQLPLVMPEVGLESMASSEIVQTPASPEDEDEGNDDSTAASSEASAMFARGKSPSVTSGRKKKKGKKSKAK